MRLPNALSFACIALLAATEPAAGRENGSAKIAVQISDTGHDELGHRLAFALKEAVRASHGYELVQSRAAFRLSIVTMDPDGNGPYLGSRTAIAWTMAVHNINGFEEGNPQTWYFLELTSGIQIAGKNTLSDAANSLLADLDSAIEDFKRECKRVRPCF